MATYVRKKHPASGHSQQLVRGLGWFSVGVGIAKVLAPRALARISGVPAASVLLVLCGLREVACGIGLLTQDQPAPWLKARIAGDTLDLAGFAAATLIPGTDRRRVAITGAAVAAVIGLDLYCSHQLATRGRRVTPRHDRAVIEIARPALELYRFWRDFSNLPYVLPHLKSVQVLDASRSHWVAAGPRGAALEWDTEIIDDVPGERIAWRSIDGSPIFNAGSVQFFQSGDVTVATVELLYEPPASTMVKAVARLFGAAQDGESDLRAFKQMMERS